MLSGKVCGGVLPALLYITFFTSPVQAQSHITITFNYVNGTWIPVVPSPPSQSYQLATQIVAVFFLFLLLLLSLVGNILIITTITSSITLRRLHTNILLIQLSIVSLVEAICNIGLSIVYLISHPWALGWGTCFLNSFLMEVVPMVETVSLALLAYDRSRILKMAHVYRKPQGAPSARGKCMVGLVWFLACALASPVVSGVIQAWPFPRHYSCQLMHEWAPYYGFYTGLLVFLLPWGATLIFLILAFRAVQKERRKEALNQRGSTAPKFGFTTALFMASNQMWLELRKTLLLVILLLVYLLLKLPYIILVKEDQIRQLWHPYNLAYYRNLTDGYFHYGSTETDSNNPTNTGLVLHESSYWDVPEVTEGGDYETALLWMRYVQAALHPFIVFAFSQDIRAKAAELLICWRDTTVDSAAARPISAILHRRSQELGRQKKMNRFQLTNCQVPVLFATNEGLHLRMLDPQASRDGLKGEVVPEVSRGQWKVEPEFYTETCDHWVDSGRRHSLQGSRTVVLLRYDGDDELRHGDKDALLGPKVKFREPVLGPHSPAHTDEASETRREGRKRKKKRINPS